MSLSPGDKRQMDRRCPYLDENRHVLQITPAPFVKRLQKLQAVALRVHIHIEAHTISRWVLVGVLTWVKVFDREFITVRWFQFELLTIWGCKIISLWVEFQRARNGQCGHDLKDRRRNLAYCDQEAVNPRAYSAFFKCTSGEVTKACVAGLASFLAVKFLLNEVTIVFFSPFFTSRLNRQNMLIIEHQQSQLECFCHH